MVFLIALLESALGFLAGVIVARHYSGGRELRLRLKLALMVQEFQELLDKGTELDRRIARFEADRVMTVLKVQEELGKRMGKSKAKRKAV